MTTNSNSLDSTVFLKKLTFYSLQHLCRQTVGYCYVQHPPVATDLRPEGQVEQFKLKEAASPPSEISVKRFSSRWEEKVNFSSCHDFLPAHRTKTRNWLFPTALPNCPPEPRDEHKDVADPRGCSRQSCKHLKLEKRRNAPTLAAKPLSHLVDL